MTKTNMNTSTPVLLLFLVFLTATNIAGFPRTHVTIINGLEPPTDLAIHCKSKDDDLGFHILPFGSNFSFSFHPNFWGTTLFFCGMRWNFSPPKWFDVFDASNDYQQCQFCIYNWKIVADGPCLFNWDSNDFDRCFPWNN